MWTLASVNTSTNSIKLHVAKIWNAYTFNFY